MAKSKYDFITELLEHKKLSTVQRERILRLAAKEIKNENTEDEGLLKRNEEIEEAEKPKDDPPSGNPHENPKYINPEKLYHLLKDYNRDPILKTTCHEIDINELQSILEFCQTKTYDFIKHRQKVHERFFNLVDDKKYYVSYHIKDLMYKYLTGKTYKGVAANWTHDKININWSSESLQKWCFYNTNKIPHPNSGLCSNQGGSEFEIRPSINTRIFGKTKKLRNFSELVLHFKYLFHLRSDNSLLKIIRDINDNSENWVNKIHFEIDYSNSSENFEFFTNVEKLIEAYKILTDLILEVAEKNKLEKPIVKLSLVQLEDGMQFSIHHKNSVFKKSVQDTIENKDGQTFANLIKYQINGLCDLYLKADFGHGQFAEINIWNGQPKVSNPIVFFEGVEYILRFKK